MTASNFSVPASVKMTPSAVKRSTPPRTLIAPSLIFGERADIDTAARFLLFNHLARGCPLEAPLRPSFFEIAHRQPQHRRVDEIDETRGQPPV